MKRLTKIDKDAKSHVEAVKDTIADFAKKAKELVKPDHAISILSAGIDGQSYIDDNGSNSKEGRVTFDLTHLAKKVSDITDCFYFDIHEK